MNRRAVLKVALLGTTAVGASVTLGGLLEVLTLPDGRRVALARAVVVADPNVCSGCRVCEIVCANLWSQGRNGASLSRLILDKDYLGGDYRPKTCWQCAEPPCLPACPVTALLVDARSGTYARVIDERACIGCRRCLEACARYFGPPAPSVRRGPHARHQVPPLLRRASVRRALPPRGAPRRARGGQPPDGVPDPPGDRRPVSAGGGWVGKILRVDLSSGKISETPTSDYVPRFLGGRGLGAKICWDEVPPEVSAFDPEARLVFATGPLQGTLAPTSGRFMLLGKAPQTAPVESYCRSGVGGHWAPELKWAGYDALVVHGRAPKPVYLWISDGTAALHDASRLWGLDTYRTQLQLWGLHGKKTRVMTIGRAGENRSRIACILTDSGDASGQGGFGGVMGSKNLKAIAVSGTGADPYTIARRISRASAPRSCHNSYRAREVQEPVSRRTR